MSVEDRATGWLSECFHLQAREVLLHGLHRYACSCPAYVLMPDHMHFLVIGISPTADQWLLVRFLRQHLAYLLGRQSPGLRLQKQAYDHVLRYAERDRFGLERIGRYIAANPVRAGLVGNDSAYPFAGCIVPGFPQVAFWAEDYWDWFWRVTKIE